MNSAVTLTAVACISQFPRTGDDDGFVCFAGKASPQKSDSARLATWHLPGRANLPRAPALSSPKASIRKTQDGECADRAIESMRPSWRNSAPEPHGAHGRGTGQDFLPERPDWGRPPRSRISALPILSFDRWLMNIWYRWGRVPADGCEKAPALDLPPPMLDWKRPEPPVGSPPGF
jgi:hypothetical protein